MPPFMSDRAAPVEHAAGDLGTEGGLGPRVLLAHRHDVGMAGEAQMRRAGAEARVEVLHVGRAGLGMVRRWQVKPAGSSTLASNVNAPPSSGVTLLQRIRAWARATGSRECWRTWRLSQIELAELGVGELGVGKAIPIQHC